LREDLGEGGGGVLGRGDRRFKEWNVREFLFPAQEF